MLQTHLFGLVYIAVLVSFCLKTTGSFPSTSDLSCCDPRSRPNHLSNNPPSMATSSPSSGPGIGGQALLKRRTGSSFREFREHYIGRHGPIAIPWCLANGVSYYAQAYTLVARTCVVHANFYRYIGHFAGRRRSSRLNIKHSASSWKIGMLSRRWSSHRSSRLMTTIEQILAKLTIWL